MFIKQNIFEKLLKEAYNGGGIYVSCTNSDTNEPIYVIAGAWWCIWVGVEWLTKEAKGAVIKLCGDLPQIGEAYMAKKDSVPQYAIDDKYHNLLMEYAKCGNQLTRTRLMVSYCGNTYSVLQDTGGEIFLLDKRISSMVSYNAVQYEDGEKEPAGPFISKSKGSVYWKNNAVVLMAVLYTIPEEDENFWKTVGSVRVI